MLEPDSQPRFIRAIMQCAHSVENTRREGAAAAGGAIVRGAPCEMAVVVEVCILL